MSVLIEKFRLAYEWQDEGREQYGGFLPKGVKFSAIAGFGQAEDGDLCFCDRLAGDFSYISNDSPTILCTPVLVDRLRVHFPYAKLVALADPRAIFLDLIGHLQLQNALQPTSLIVGPWGTSEHAEIGSGSYVHPESRIDAGARIGMNCIIRRGVWIKSDATIEDGTVVGVSGINAYRSADGRILRFPHLAGVIVEENVAIGANNVLVAGVLNSTVIGSNSILGNLCNIGHGVTIGPSVWMSVGCKIGGHSSIGAHVTVGMGATIRDNLSVGECAHIGMGSVVTKSVPAGRSMFGNPARAMPGVVAGPAR